MRDGLVYCRSHYQELPMISPDYDEHYTSPSPDFSHHHHHSHHHNHHHHHSSIHSSETPSPSNPDSVKVNSFFNGAPTPRQKGRPRKRKPKDIEGLTANLGESNTIEIYYSTMPQDIPHLVDKIPDTLR
jgi:hypothetical protein